MFKNIQNAEIFITGYIFPVPAKLLDVCNAFFTSAGSCRACMRTGIPTISYDANDFRPIGILGRTTNQVLMRDDNEPIPDFSELMDDILERKIYEKETQIPQIDKPDFSSHDEFVSLMSSKHEYFNFDDNDIEIKEKIKSICLRILGANTYSKLGALKNILLTKIKLRTTSK